MASLRASRAWTRRQFLVRSTSGLAVATLAKPHLSRAADRPQIAGGIQSGDASDGSAVIWARADRPARMQVECSTVESFKTIIASASSANPILIGARAAPTLCCTFPPPLFHHRRVCSRGIAARIRWAEIS
jgi:hypothetical protein